LAFWGEKSRCGFYFDEGAGARGQVAASGGRDAVAEGVQFIGGLMAAASGE